jgi:hypothetical protein
LKLERKLNRRPNRTNTIQRYGQKSIRHNRPFWLPASNYYILTAALAILFFFLIWGILHDGNDEMPWVGAGIGASFILGGAVFLREVVLRHARSRYINAERRLDNNIAALPLANHAAHDPNKLTLEKNAAIIKQIKQKSDAAKVLGKLSNGHLEVFEICNEYLLLSKDELRKVAVGSPRIAALRKGREIVKNLHRFHLLEWAEIEARSLTRDAKNNVTINEKLEASQKALDVIHTALEYYPDEMHLIKSEEALTEFVATIKISHWIEQAERSAFKGNYKKAVGFYQDALFYLNRENFQTRERQLLYENINAEIDKIRGLEDIKKGNREISKKTSNLEEHYD